MYEPAQDDDDTAVGSRPRLAIVGMAAVLAVLGLGGLAYVWFSNSSRIAKPHDPGIALDQPTRHAESMAAGRPPLNSMRSPGPSGGFVGQAKRKTETAPPSSKEPPAPKETSINFALLRAAPRPLWGDASAGFPGYPRQAFWRLPTALSDGDGALTINTATTSVWKAPWVVKASAQSSKSPPTSAPPSTLSAHRPTTPPTLEPAAVAPDPLTESPPKLLVPKLAAAQTAVAGSGPIAEQPNPHAARPRATSPARDPGPVGMPIHLQIVYASSGPQEAKEIAALQAKILGQVTTIATAGVSEWPVRHEIVIYFFPGDRAAASLVAASLAQITKRTAPLMLLRTKSAPRPGTVDILLPLRSGEDLRKDNR